MKILITIFSTIIYAYMAYYFVLSTIALLGKREIVRNFKPLKKFLIVIPAKNEENVIDIPCRDLLHQRYPKNMFDVFVWW